ncbi:15507_t:CDS:2, partial [Racocetra persica]
LPSQEAPNIADKPLSISNSLKLTETPNITPPTKVDKTLKCQYRQQAQQLPITQIPNLLFTQQLIERELTPEQIAQLVDQLKAN